jgi:CBS domain-containing protein
MSNADGFFPYTIGPGDTLEEALSRIQANGHRSVIVVDSKARVVGTLSDGDVRKALLDRRLLSTRVSLVMNLNFIGLSPSEKHQAPELFEKNHIFLIPVIGENNQLVEVLRAY